MLELRELTLYSIPIRILAATLASGFIGLERGMKNRAAGFRTHMLVSIGACLIMILNQDTFQVYQLGDPVRMGAQVISGIGFLGAGSIIVTKHNQIKGLTTAAGLWASACIGLTFGIGFYEAAIPGTVAVFLSLTVFHTWEERMRRNAKALTFYAELKQEKGLSDFLRAVREDELTLRNLQIEEDRTGFGISICFWATAKGKKKLNRKELLSRLQRNSCVQYLEEL